MEPARCELCGRRVAARERHHLIPRTRHRNKRSRKRFTRQEVRERMVMLCGPCHRTLHATFTAKELESDYDDLESIRAHPAICKFVQWIRKRPAGKGIRVRRKAGDDLRRRDQLRRRLRKTRRGRQEA
jgi:hypothetical protein